LLVLDSINLSVGSGEFVALLGSGCGESTLLRLISGLEQPSKDSIAAHSVTIDRPGRSRILVFQDPTLFPWTTVWNKVATGLDDPVLLLLYEPLGKLDCLTRMSLQAELSALWREAGVTAILVTCDVEEALVLASRVIVLTERAGRSRPRFRLSFPYRRQRDDPELAAMRGQILGTLGLVV
jgi:NitT/TauT family transport system ATP-binding protein